MQVKQYLSISLLLAALAACQTNPEVVVPQLAPQAGARVTAQVYSEARINHMRSAVHREYKDHILPLITKFVLRSNSKLDAVAQKQLNYMVANNSKRPNESTLASLITAEGYALTTAVFAVRGYDYQLAAIKSEALETDRTKYEASDSRVASKVGAILAAISANRSTFYKDYGLGFSYDAKANQYVIFFVIASPK